MRQADQAVRSVSAGPAIPRRGRGRPSALSLLVGFALLLPGCAKRPTSGAADAAAAKTPPPGPAAADPGEIVVDPFCGMNIERGEAAASAEWRGTTYWFCLADHRDAFLADPQRSLCRRAEGDAGPAVDGR